MYSNVLSRSGLPILLSSVICFLSLVIVGCSGSKKPEIAIDIDECAHCKMVIGRMNEACGYFVGNEFVTFDSPVCLLREYQDMKKKGAVIPQPVYFVDYTTSRFISSDSAWFLLSDHIPTVMNAGVICFVERESAQSYMKYQDEKLTDWIGFQTLRGEPDKIIQVSVTPEGLKPDVIVLNKNDLVEWIFNNQGLQQAESFYLKGYDEMGEIQISPQEDIVTVRMLAKHPGAGFPFIRYRDEKPVGMVKVLGAHTSDEEVM